MATVGSVYVGLVPWAGFADFGHNVAGVDIDPKKVAKLYRAEMSIYEPGLADLLPGNVWAGRLVFTTDLAFAMEGVAVVMIALRILSRRGDSDADLSFTYATARDIARNLSDLTVVVTKSIVLVGMGD